MPTKAYSGVDPQSSWVIGHSEFCDRSGGASMAEWSGRIRGALSRAAVRTAQRAEGPPRTTQETLVEWARAHVRDRRLVVISNREPYSHVHRNGGVRVIRNAGGLT